MISLPDPLKRLFLSMKFWTVILWMILTPLASWLAKVGFELSDATVQHIAEYMTLIFSLLLGGQALTDHGKEKAKVEAKTAIALAVGPDGKPIYSIEDMVKLVASGQKITAPPKQPEAGFIAMKLMGVLAVLGLAAAPVVSSGCGPQGPGPVIGQLTVDCLGTARPQIDALLGEFKGLLTGGGFDWSAVYQRAKQAGKVVGGCALAELVQFYLGGTRSIEEGDGWKAHSTLEQFRTTEAGGATFKARCTRTDGTTSECKL